ncbi:hypothetical protein PRIP_04868 [Listeria riparia FSL S10-1204]|uniref:Uncharacterized protein n=1 Tax=Listeria riparia FSL S10-1204 TaxID=1265816 RepID=W7D9M2_9LIST|nr:hypothetical protein PRIP_04868 [Listeria riparia FSL S10-1204]
MQYDFVMAKTKIFEIFSQSGGWVLKTHSCMFENDYQLTFDYLFFTITDIMVGEWKRFLMVFLEGTSF